MHWYKKYPSEFLLSFLKRRSWKVYATGHWLTYHLWMDLENLFRKSCFLRQLVFSYENTLKVRALLCWEAFHWYYYIPATAFPFFQMASNNICSKGSCVLLSVNFLCGLSFTKILRNTFISCNNPVTKSVRRNCPLFHRFYALKNISVVTISSISRYHYFV